MKKGLYTHIYIYPITLYTNETKQTKSSLVCLCLWNVRTCRITINIPENIGTYGSQMARLTGV